MVIVKQLLQLQVEPTLRIKDLVAAVAAVADEEITWNNPL
jgi:hypothetical protein